VDGHAFLVATFFYFLAAVAGLLGLEVIVSAHLTGPAVIGELRSPLLALEIDGSEHGRPISWFFRTKIHV